MLVIDGKKIEIPGVPSKCFLDNPKFTFSKGKYSDRKLLLVKTICIHTRLGLKTQKAVKNTSKTKWAEDAAARINKGTKKVSWHISINPDGSYVCHLDLLRIKAYHAGHMNDFSVGIEIYQDTKGTITSESLNTLVSLVDYLTREFSIQRQVALDEEIVTRLASSSKGTTKSQQLAYLPGGGDGKDYFGVFGHRNMTRNRGFGDPGNLPFDRLIEAGYEAFYLEDKEDLVAWRKRQEAMNIVVDGIPGTQTLKALKELGFPHGLLVKRPGDSDYSK